MAQFPRLQNSLVAAALECCWDEIPSA